MEKKQKTGKEMFMGALAETVDMFPDVDWDKIQSGDYADSDEPVNGETVLGEMTENQKIMYSVLDQLTERFNNRVKEDPTKNPEMDNLKNTLDMLIEVVFYSITNHFDAHNKNIAGIGIRTGHKIVALEPHNPFEAMIMGRGC